MKGLRAEALRQLSPQELEQKVVSMRGELLQIHLKARIAGVEKPAHIRRLRQDIARTLTVLREKRT